MSLRPLLGSSNRDANRESFVVAFIQQRVGDLNGFCTHQRIQMLHGGRVPRLVPRHSIAS